MQLDSRIPWWHRLALCRLTLWLVRRLEPLRDYQRYHALKAAWPQDMGNELLPRMFPQYYREKVK